MDPLVQAVTNPSPRMLVVCFDGTWENADKELKGATNVKRLYDCIEENPWKQTRHYIGGIGADDEKLPGKIHKGLTGRGLFQDLRAERLESLTPRSLPAKILEAYKWICQECTHDKTERDEIYLIGFSRGACTARAVARLLNDIGIMMHYDFRDAWDDVWKAYKSEKNNNTLDGTFWSKLNLPKHVRYLTAKVKVCAVFDTVRTLWSTQAPGVSYLQYADVDSNIENAIQALALQEHRPGFPPEVWKRGPNQQSQYLKQCWFLGHHSDVGGGEVGASNVSLVWMIKEIRGCSELQFDNTKISTCLSGGLLRDEKYLLKDKAKSNLHSRSPGGYHIGEVTGECVHWSTQNFVSQGLCFRESSLSSGSVTLQDLPTYGLSTEKIHPDEITLLQPYIVEFANSEWYLNHGGSTQSAQTVSDSYQGGSGSLAQYGSENPGSQAAYSHSTQAASSSTASSSSMYPGSQSTYNNSGQVTPANSAQNGYPNSIPRSADYHSLPVSGKTQKYASTYSYPTTGTQPYASSPYDTGRSTQQATYGKISAVADTQKYSGTYAYPTTNTQPYASSPYGTARSTQQAMYGTTSAFVDTQVNDYKRWAPSQSETYADVKNNLTWTYGEKKSSMHTVDPVTKENLTAHYYSEEYLRTWAFYRQSGEFVHIG